MKRKTFGLLLSCEAVLCIMVCFWGDALPNMYSAIVIFPFSAIGFGLRNLSLSGNVGNILAIMLYVALCLSPIIALLLLGKKRKLRYEDGLLVLLSVLLFAVIYSMINPLPVVNMLLASTTYSVLLGYVIIRLVRLFFAADTVKLQKYLIRLLQLLNVFFVAMIFGFAFRALLDSYQSLSTNTILGNDSFLLPQYSHIENISLPINYLFLTLQYIINILPYMLDMLIVFAGLALLKEFHTDHYSKDIVIAAKRLSRLCGVSLAIIVLSNMIFNLLQVVFSKSLVAINTAIEVPIPSIIFVLIALLLAQYIKENKLLKEDNEMFI